MVRATTRETTVFSFFQLLVAICTLWTIAFVQNKLHKPADYTSQVALPTDCTVFDC